MDNVLPVVSSSLQCVRVRTVIKQDVLQKYTLNPFVFSCHYIVSGHVRINAETILMRSTVVKKDTASDDIVHGSSRSEINGETIMRLSTLVKNNNAETIMMHSTVVKKDTTSFDVFHGSSRFEIYRETIMRHSTVVKNNKAAISDIGSDQS